MKREKKIFKEKKIINYQQIPTKQLAFICVEANKQTNKSQIHV